jgi:hypothetical protein
MRIATEESRSQRTDEPVSTSPASHIHAENLHLQTFPQSTHSPLTREIPHNDPHSAHSREVQFAKNPLQAHGFPHELADVIQAFRMAGYASFFETSQTPQKSLYAYKHLTRIFRVQPWEVVNASPPYWGRDLLQFLSTLALLLAGTSDPLRLAKTMLEGQIESRRATGPEAVLKLGDVRKAIREWKEKGGNGADGILPVEAYSGNSNDDN